MIVKIEKWEYERAFAVGIARCTARWGSKDAPHYADKSRQEDNRTAEVASSLCDWPLPNLSTDTGMVTSGITPSIICIGTYQM